MTIRTVPSNIYVVTVENRIDGVFAFTSEGEAERFIATLRDVGSTATVAEVPLNANPFHTDDLIQAEKESNVWPSTSST
jgi:hypothetical protein